VLAVALGGCGSGGSERSTLNATFGAFPDSLDPALGLTSESWNTMQNVNLPLLTYEHASGEDGLRLIPALAEEMPKISADGRRYEFTLRPGLRYSDGTPVRASDFRATIERLFRVSSPGSPFFTDIVGAERFAETLEGGISGIEADDSSRRIVIRLVRPRGTFANELATLYAALIPADTPDRVPPAEPPPATGPYAITEVKPGSAITLRRNPAWLEGNAEAMPQLPGGDLETIEIKVLSNSSTQVNDVESGRVDWMKGPPPPDRLPEIRRRFLDTQFREEPTISLFYFWMDTQTPPFDDLRVRRAVNHAVDPAALERIYAGTITPTQQVLPPPMPGHRRFELYPHDMRKARALIAAAAPDDREITVWVQNVPPHDEAAQYYQDVLRRLGFETTLKVINSTNYYTVIGEESTPDLDTGWGSWLLDYPHPNDYFEPQLAGTSILPAGSTNWARFDDPSVNSEIARLAARPLDPDAYARLDQKVMRRAPWAPFGNFTNATFVSDAIDLDAVIFSPIFGQDLTSFEFR